MTTKTQAKAATGSFAYRFNPSTQKWNVFEDGKFRRPFDTEQEAKNFIDGELAKKTKKGKPHA